MYWNLQFRCKSLKCQAHSCTILKKLGVWQLGCLGMRAHSQPREARNSISQATSVSSGTCQNHVIDCKYTDTVARFWLERCLFLLDRHSNCFDYCFPLAGSSTMCVFPRTAELFGHRFRLRPTDWKPHSRNFSIKTRKREHFKRQTHLKLWVIEASVTQAEQRRQVTGEQHDKSGFSARTVLVS